MKGMQNIINEYITETGEAPYSNWLNSLKDLKGRTAVISHVDRMELGNFGDCKPVGDEIVELRIHFGPGYRVYYARDGKNIYLLLCGGNKSSQKKDIKQAKKYWANHKRGKQ